MTQERKIQILESLLKIILRKKDLNFDGFKRELGNLAKSVGAEPDEIKLVLGPIVVGLVHEVFDVKES